MRACGRCDLIGGSYRAIRWDGCVANPSFLSIPWLWLICFARRLLSLNPPFLSSFRVLVPPQNKHRGMDMATDVIFGGCSAGAMATTLQVWMGVCIAFCPSVCACANPSIRPPAPRNPRGETTALLNDQQASHLHIRVGRGRTAATHKQNTTTFFGLAAGGLLGRPHRPLPPHHHQDDRRARLRVSE